MGEDETSVSGAVLTLRNPSKGHRRISLDAKVIFELPEYAADRGTIKLQSPYGDQHPQRLTLDPGRAVDVALKPFDVLVFDTVAAWDMCPSTQIVTTHVTMG